jgi:hypothetical protein
MNALGRRRFTLLVWAALSFFVAATDSYAQSDDTIPPAFTGVRSLSVDCAGPGAQLGWDPAIDETSPPEAIRYRLYLPSFGTVGAPRTESAPGETTLSLPLDRGVTYFFLVRAVDAAGNEDSNLRVLNSVVPTDCGPPLGDDLAPVFDGLEAVDLVPGSTDTVVLSWNPATDDTTAQAKIRYRLYVPSFGSIGTRQGETAPGATSLTFPIVNGVTHYFLIRALDLAGNEDSNLRILSIREPEDTGFIPSTADVSKCEESLSKSAAKLVAAIHKCHRSRARAALKQRPFDEEGCEQAARAKYDDAGARLFADGTCPSCLADNAAAVADHVENDLDENNGKFFCDGIVPLP